MSHGMDIPILDAYKAAEVRSDGKREEMRASEKPFNWAEDVDAPSSVGFDHITPPANADMSRMTPLRCPLNRTRQLTSTLRRSADLEGH